jgi:hypothetical protein
LLLVPQLAHLTTSTSPDVVAAAADAAIKALGNENPQARRAFQLSEKEYQTRAFSSNHARQSDDVGGGDRDVEMHGHPGRPNIWIIGWLTITEFFLYLLVQLIQPDLLLCCLDLI